ncbi:MAG TPA: serine/threonine-protein kinase [Thermoanaerobaculia bacterium]|nr:serine/threonine-protein kinase [Thermoanaerobaculia bacterium]
MSERRGAVPALSDPVLDRLRGALAAPELPERYVLGQPLGRGGMATVWRAHDLLLDREVAFKVLDLPEGEDDLAERLLREARVLAQLEHPGIVPVHDVGTLSAGRVFYAMKLVQGRRLDDVVRDGASLPERLRLFLRACEPVAFAHARGVLHRDLKPENVMTGPFGEVLVLDWGLAKKLDDREPAKAVCGSGTDITGHTGHEMRLGTPAYMPPEQREAGIVDERSDVYALGGVLHYLLHGAAPGECSVHLAKPVARRLASIVNRARALKPEARYATVSALAADVERFLAGSPVLAHPESLAERGLRLLSRHKVVVVLLLVYVLVRLALLLIAGR